MDEARVLRRRHPHTRVLGDTSSDPEGLRVSVLGPAENKLSIQQLHTSVRDFCRENSGRMR